MKPQHPEDELLVELTSGDEARAEAAALKLAEAGERVLPALESLLRSKDADHRWWAVRTLGQMASPRHDWLVDALRDASSEVRAAAALALVTHPAQEAAPSLLSVLGDEDGVVAVLAVNALIAIGKGAVPPLLDAYPQLNQRGRIHAMRALADLADLHDGRAIRLMMKTMEEDSAMLRYWAGIGLERLGLDMVYVKPE